MKVNFEYVRQLKNELDAINEVPFESIEWYENGQPVEVTKSQLKAWKQDCGLENTNFPDQREDY